MLSTRLASTISAQDSESSGVALTQARTCQSTTQAPFHQRLHIRRQRRNASYLIQPRESPSNVKHTTNLPWSGTNLRLAGWKR